MDRRRTRSGALTAALALAFASIASAAAAPPLRAQRWLSPDADPVAALTREPTECLTPPLAPEDHRRVEIGRAAFRSPLLLGGQAARAGLSCEACHRSGRGNPDFLFPGLSGAAGTADVTSSLLSSHRGDGVHNPRPIPDLSGPRTVLSRVADPDPATLSAFIRGLIVEEFDGPEPPATVLEGVTAYVRALAPGACPTDPTQAVRPVARLDDARRAVRAAAEAAAHDPATAVVLLNAARAELGLIHERYAGAELAASRERLRTSDLELAAGLAALRAGAPDVPSRLIVWLVGSQALERRLVDDAPRSLFDPGALAAATGRNPPRAGARR